MDNNQLMINGVKEGDPVYVSPSLDPDGSVYYAQTKEWPYKYWLIKDGSVIRDFEYDWNTYSSTSSAGCASGGGYFFIPVTTDNDKTLLVMRYSDKGEDKVITVYKGNAYSRILIKDVAADSKGNVYIATSPQTSDDVYHAVLWKVDTGGKVTKYDYSTRAGGNTNCLSVAVSGTDAWSLVDEGWRSHGSVLALYKNGTRQYEVTDKMDRRSSVCCDISVSGSNVFVLANVYDNQETMSGVVTVFKNGNPQYTLGSKGSVLAFGLFVTKKGDVYAATHSPVPNQYVIWKNKEMMWQLKYSSSGYAVTNFFVKE